MRSDPIRNRDWKSQLVSAVSPLELGVRPLKVRGFSPPGESNYRPGLTAAVLVPIIDQPEPEIVLTLRSKNLAHHPGQVSFPGGAVEEVDGSAVETAMREAFEEIGIPRTSITPLGFLDRYDSISDYRILPVVGLMKPIDAFVLDRTEVDEVFTVPWSYITDRSNYRQIEREHSGVRHTIWSLTWEDRLVWGVTAAILRNLVDRIHAAQVA